MLFASAVPAKVGVFTLVIPSPFVPLSLPLDNAGAEGAAGAVWSIVIVTAVPEPVFGPLPLVTLAVMVPV